MSVLLIDETISIRDVRKMRAFVVKNNGMLRDFLGYDMQKYIRQQSIEDEIKMSKKNIAVKFDDGNILGLYSLRFEGNLFFPNKDGENMIAFELSNFSKNNAFEKFIDYNFSEIVFKELILPKLKFMADRCYAKVVYANVPMHPKLVQIFSHEFGFSILEDNELRKQVQLGNGFPPKTVFMYRKL